MELRHLRTFIAAAECESFTKAAQSLDVTQGAVSQQVAALEKHMGVTLFQRIGRTVELTEQGHLLQSYAIKIIELVERAENELRNETPNVHGTLRIASSTVPAESLLPELLIEFRKQYPNVNESVSVTDSEQTTKTIKDGKADVGFVGSFPHDVELTAEAIGSDELVLVAPPDHAFAGQESISLKDLSGEPLIVREPGSASRGCVETGLESKSIRLSDLNIAIEVNSNEAIRTAVQRGAGIGFLSKAATASDVQAGTLAAVKVRGLKLQRKLYMITDKRRIDISPLREFLTFVHES